MNYWFHLCSECLQWGCKSVTSMGVGFPGRHVEGVAWAACPQEGEGGWGMRVRPGARCSQGFDNLPDLGDTGERESQSSTSTSPGGTLPLSSSSLGHRSPHKPVSTWGSLSGKYQPHAKSGLAFLWHSLLTSNTATKGPLRGAAIRGWTKHFHWCQRMAYHPACWPAAPGL